MFTRLFVGWYRLVRSAALAGALAIAGGCRDQEVACVALPCPLPAAISAVVTSTTGAPLAGLFVDVSVPIVVRFPCDASTGRCTVGGNPGNYTLSFGAPGYQSMQRNVIVSAARSPASCGCSGVITQELQITLAPLP